MYTTKQMPAIIQALATKHNFDLMTPDQSLVLYNEPYTRLVIGVEAPGLVSVAHRPDVEPGEDPISDPDMLFYTGYGDAWVPVEMTFVTGHYQRATVLDCDSIPVQFYPRAQREQAAFANMWARNLRAQRWLQQATRAEEPVAA